MKTDAPDRAHGGAAVAEVRTRNSVARLLLERGTVTAAELADALGVSPAGVRRHLESMAVSGEAVSVPVPVGRPRGRGRPARRWQLTRDGRARFGHAYDDLAVEALRALQAVGGPAAISEFARRRMVAVTASVEVGARRGDTARSLARSLSAAGYAATVEPGPQGVQLCQHHCPVAHVAAEFPQLCDAERDAFAAVLGTHVQRLATIANGDQVCTTHIPDRVHVRETVGAPERSGPPGTPGSGPRSPEGVIPQPSSRSPGPGRPVSATQHRRVSTPLRKEPA